VRIINFKNKIIRAFIECCFIFGVFFILTGTAYAIDTYAPGETATLGEFIYNDDYTPTADDCTITIQSPSLAILVNNVTMTDEGTVPVTGWHYYTYTIPATQGKYPAYITCGSTGAGNLFKLDKSFIVKAPPVTSSDISGAVTTINTNTNNATSGLATATNVTNAVAGLATTTQLNTVSPVLPQLPMSLMQQEQLPVQFPD
jgi:hypothetical protein